MGYDHGGYRLLHAGMHTNYETCTMANVGNDRLLVNSLRGKKLKSDRVFGYKGEYYSTCRAMVINAQERTCKSMC